MDQEQEPPSSINLSSDEGMDSSESEGEVTERIVTSLHNESGERSKVNCGGTGGTAGSSHSCARSWVRASAEDDILSEEDSSLCHEEDIAAAEVLPPPRIDDVDEEMGDTVGGLPSFPVGQDGDDDDTVATGYSTETANVENSMQATRARIQRNMEQSRGYPRIEASRLENLNLAGPQPLTRKVSAQSSASSGTGVSSSRRRIGLDPMILPIDEQGHAMSPSELRVVWKEMGRCLECGKVQTHRKVKYGPFGSFRKMEPLTVDAMAYKGFCLACYDVEDLRLLLNEPDIPEDLRRPMDTESWQPEDDNLMLKVPKSAMGILCSSRKFQCCVVIVALGLVLGGIAAAVQFFSHSAATQQVITNPPTGGPSVAPSMAPTMAFWNLVGEIRSDVPSFGRSVQLDETGNRIAVSAPFANDATGQVVVYEQHNDSVSDWNQVGQALRGFKEGDEAGFSIALTPDGTTVAMGLPGSDSSMVYRDVVEGDGHLWLPVDLPMEGNISSRFGHSVAMNSNGTRVVVGAPGADGSDMFGVGGAYVYELVEGRWKQLLGDADDGSVRGASKPGDAFGVSVAMNERGNMILVGAPLDSSRWDRGGQVYVFERKIPSNSNGEGEESVPTESVGTEEWVDRAVEASNDHKSNCDQEGETRGAEENHQFGGSSLVFVRSWFVGSENTENGAGIVKVINAFEKVCGGWLAGGTAIFGGQDAGRDDDKEGFGIGVDAAMFGGMVVAGTTRNVDSRSGEARVYRSDEQGFGWSEIGYGVGHLPVAKTSGVSPASEGPGVSVRIRDERTVRLAVGFENVVDSDGSVTPGLVRIYDYVAPEEWFQSRSE